jgi:hypothetical protein
MQQGQVASHCWKQASGCDPAPLSAPVIGKSMEIVEKSPAHSWSPRRGIQTRGSQRVDPGLGVREEQGADGPSQELTPLRFLVLPFGSPSSYEAPQLLHRKLQGDCQPP